MKKKVTLKKLELSKEKIETLSQEQGKSVKGGFFGSRVLCFQSDASAGCTSHTRCRPNYPGDAPGQGTILCFD